MNAPRRTRAKTTPSSKTRPWYCPGTAERPMSRTKINRLSRDRLYSVSQPAKNWPAAGASAATARTPPNTTARAVTPRVQSAASRRLGRLGRRPLSVRSAATTAARTAIVAAHSPSGTCRGSMGWPKPRGSASRPPEVQRAQLAGPRLVARARPRERSDDPAAIQAPDVGDARAAFPVPGAPAVPRSGTAISRRGVRQMRHGHGCLPRLCGWYRADGEFADRLASVLLAGFIQSADQIG